MSYHISSACPLISLRSSLRYIPSNDSAKGVQQFRAHVGALEAILRCAQIATMQLALAFHIATPYHAALPT